MRTPPIVATQKKPEPWFLSSKLPPIKGEVLSSNERTLSALLKSSANGNLSMYQADALSSGKDRAIGEYGDFLRQMYKHAPERIKDFEKEVMERLPAETKAKLATYLNQPSLSTRPKSITKSLFTGDGGNNELSTSTVKTKNQKANPITDMERATLRVILAVIKWAKGL